MKKSVRISPVGRRTKRQTTPRKVATSTQNIKYSLPISEICNIKIGDTSHNDVHKYIYEIETR